MARGLGTPALKGGTQNNWSPPFYSCTIYTQLSFRKDPRKSDHPSHSSKVAHYVRYTIKLKMPEIMLLFSLAAGSTVWNPDRGHVRWIWRSLVGWTLITAGAAATCFPFREAKGEEILRVQASSWGPTASLAMCPDLGNAGVAWTAWWDTDGSSVHPHVPRDPNMLLTQDQTPASPGSTATSCPERHWYKGLLSDFWWHVKNIKLEITSGKTLGKFKTKHS